MAAWATAYFSLTRVRGEDSTALERWRRGRVLLAVEHLAFVLLIAAGAFAAWRHGWDLGTARWFAVKVGLVVFLIVPLETFHAYVCHGWIGRGLRQTVAPPFSKDLVRGIGIEEMLRTLALPLFGIAVPLIFWLSLSHPF